MKVLIVDDKYENLYLIDSLLKASGYETATSMNGAEALSSALEDHPDLIISDILMPVMDGFTFCRECKKNRSLKNIPFIFYTATYTESKDEEFALSLGADRFILKPQDPDVFLSIVEEILNEVKEKKFRPNKSQGLPEEFVLKEYNSALVRKLEDKMKQTEEAEKELRKINAELQKEIEEHKISQNALRESEERYRLVQENSMDAIFFTLPDGTILGANKAACELFGMTEGELSGLRKYSLVDTSDPRFSQMLEERKLNGRARSELILIRKDGSKFPAEVSSAIFHDSHGNMRSSFIFRDITEKKQAEREIILAKEFAEKSDRLKTEFLAQVSHEIRSPMQIITSFVGLIKDQFEGETLQNLLPLLDGIDFSSQRIIRTIELILNMSEMQIGSYKPKWETINLAKEIFPDLQKEFSFKAKAKGLELNFVTPDETPLIKGDRYSVSNIFVNLLDNAVKYTEKGKIDVITSKSVDSILQVSIQDTGVGISEEFMQNIFKPFMQEERGYTRRYEGNGLGLALVKKYCDLNGVKISVESEKGSGSKFILSFNTRAES